MRLAEFLEKLEKIQKEGYDLDVSIIVNTKDYAPGQRGVAVKNVAIGDIGGGRNLEIYIQGHEELFVANEEEGK
jgi:hypothetical protein